MTSLFHNLWYALRRLRKSPGFTASAITMLAVGIGANIAIFSLLNTVMLRELPVREPGSLVQLLSRYPGEPRVNSFVWKAYGHFRDNNHVFSDLIIVSPSQFQVSADGIEPQSVDGAYISGSFFAALGLTPSAGRLIDPLDDPLGSAGAAVAVLSWQCWKNRFAGDSAQQITLNGIPATVIGIAPPDFFGIQVGASPGVWLSAAMETLIQQPSRRADGTLPVAVIGRLKSGASIEQARSEITTLDRWRIDDWAARTKDPLISFPPTAPLKSIPWSPCAMNNSDSTLRSVDCHGQAPYSMLDFFMYVSSRHHSAARYRQSAESAVALTPLASIRIFHTYKNHRGAPRTSEFRFPSSIFQIGGPHDSTQKS